MRQEKIHRQPQRLLAAPISFTGYRLAPGVRRDAVGLRGGGMTVARCPCAGSRSCCPPGVMMTREVLWRGARLWGLAHRAACSSAAICRAGEAAPRCIVRTHGNEHGRWGAVNEHRAALEVRRQCGRDPVAAKRLIRRLLKRWSHARVIVTDNLRSDAAVLRELGLKRCAPAA
ncbi:DDE-type integrase/transposase/recombinase [Pandoraea oxalativorans]|uniref:DDE-type integrase/transposase/recombinase n=1 Tax=Pandoraea oxalativorans TaxID=573737 RepID=UPI000B1B28A6